METQDGSASLGQGPRMLPTQTRREKPNKIKTIIYEVEEAEGFDRRPETS